MDRWKIPFSYGSVDPNTKVIGAKRDEGPERKRDAGIDRHYKEPRTPQIPLPSRVVSREVSSESNSESNDKGLEAMVGKKVNVLP